MTLLFSLPGGPVNNYIDLSQCASIVNRRFYRQGINWAVADFKVITSGGVTGTMSVQRIPHTWVAANAWKKAFNAWNKQQKEALADSGALNAAAKFRDFKIHMDVTHVANGFAANLLPAASNGVVATPGEWEASQIVLPNSGSDGSSITLPTERALHMVGINVNGTSSRGMIEGYADSRAYPQSPDPVSPDLDSSQNWLARMFDVGNDIDSVLDNATDTNDELPYDQVNYPGGAGQMAALAYHDGANVTATTVGGVTHLSGGQFYCGLIRFDTDLTIPEGQSAVLKITLVPGSHRGYLCEPMGDV